MSHGREREGKDRETEGGKEKKGERKMEKAHRENEVPTMVTGGWRARSRGERRGARTVAED